MGRGSPRARDPPRRDDADWERRRSRSPSRGVLLTPAEHAGAKHLNTDLGSALLSGALHVAEGAPSPPVLHPDPMLDFYKTFCHDDISGAPADSRTAWDPMLGEATATCATMVGRPLSFSPPSFPLEEVPVSPDYTPVSALWTKIADLNEEATALGYNNVIHFGPGVQLAQEVGGRTMATAITEQVADMVLDERRKSIMDSIFVPCEQPLLEVPVPNKGKGKAAASKPPRQDGLRRSTRQKAQTCSVPVSKRATHRLIRAFELADPSEPIGDQAMQAFVDSF